MTDLKRLAPDDWQLVREVRLRCLADSPGAFASTYEREVGYDETRWRQLLGSGAWFVAVDGEAAVGLVCGFHPDDAPVGQVHLVAMWVAAEARGTGLADRLIDAVVDWTRAEGGTEVTLGVTKGNDRARHVYERYGFLATETNVPFEGRPDLVIDIYRLEV
ncbi:MAG: GNAT family N-acetyltransferase [Frankiaceae bacterium]|nr:GNAT family N-acetyltransferase [Frankiaceae bacterium]